MQCPKCQTDNPEAAKFCIECANPFEIRCPQCGAANPVRAKFCMDCAHSLKQQTEIPVEGATAPALKSPRHHPTSDGDDAGQFPAGERKHVTVLFSDLSGYTSMNERLDPEEVEAVMSRIKMEAVTIVERREGIVNQFVGDEVLALFGIPTAHEDDPVRAVKAAFEIHDFVRRISPKVEARIGARLRMHSGISTGLVVIHIQDIRDGSYSITGDAINVGARLATRAGTDEILAGPETHSLIAPYFKTSALEPITVRGKTKPMTPYRVIEESKVQTRFEAARIQGLTAFTGREHELTSLYSCLEKTLTGKGQFVTVVGEAGLGKSRLAYEFRHSLNRSEITVLQGRCQSYGKSIPYFPHINALRRGLNLRDEDTPVELHEKAVFNVLAIDPSLEQYLPLYLHLLSIPSEAYPFPEHMHGQELTNSIQKALAAINILNARRKHYVLILEDWHWADDASDSALKHIVSVIGSHPVMILVIYRPEYTPNWGQWSHSSSIILNALENQHCKDIIKSVWGAEHLPEGFSTLIYERTGGNPFFVEEISRALIEKGQVQMVDQRAVLTQSMEHLSLPNTVQSVIRARLDRLDRHSRETLRLAAVIGREFAHRILEQISLSKEHLANSLEDLKVLELIQQISVMPEAEYMFKHVITQEVAYDTLLLQQRKDLHGRVGLAMEEIYPDRSDEQVNLLHRHFSLAENWQKAAEYGRKAANRAYRLGRFQEAAIFFDSTYSSLLEMPESQARQEDIVDVLMETIWPLHFLGQQDRILRLCKEAESVVNALNDPVRKCKVDSAYGGVYFFTNRYNLAEQYDLKILQHEQQGSEMGALVQKKKFSLAVTYLSTGHWEKAADLYSEGIQNREANGTQIVYFEDNPFLPYAHMCHHLAYIRTLQGRINEAMILIKKGHTPALTKVSNLQSKAYCGLWHSAVSAVMGEELGALDRVNKVLEIAKETDSPILCYLCYAAKGNALIAAGQFKAAQENLNQSLQTIEGTAHRRYLEAVYYNLVLVSLELEAWDEADRYYQETLPLVALNPDREAARFDFLKGRLLASGDSPDFENALVFFEKSIQADEKSGAVVPAAQSKYYLAQMLGKKGDIERSRSILNEIREKFQNWEIPFWQQKCDQALIVNRIGIYTTH